ncbi:MAG: putative selenate ABC transporter substrate-binding protein [Acidobacteriota bacterium]
MTSPRALSLFLLLVVSLLGLACTSEPPAATGPILRWTAIPDSDPQLLKQKYDPVSAYLSEALGVPVEYVPVSDYKASVEAFKAGDVQLAWFGGLTGVQARRAVTGAHAVAQGKEDPFYESYFIAHVSTGIERSESFPVGLARHPFTFGSPSSTSGRLMPEHFLRQATGKSPSDFFEQGFAFSGAHDLTARQVQEGGAVKAGVLNYKTYDRLVAAGEIDPDVARIVWVTPPYADYNFTAHPSLETDFGAGFTERLQSVLVALDDPALLDAFARSALIPAADEDFADIERTALELGLIREPIG